VTCSATAHVECIIAFPSQHVWGNALQCNVIRTLIMIVLGVGVVTVIKVLDLKFLVMGLCEVCRMCDSMSDNTEPCRRLK